MLILVAVAVVVVLMVVVLLLLLHAPAVPPLLSRSHPPAAEACRLHCARYFQCKHEQKRMYKQVGLAGSSALVTATLKCLVAFYSISERPLHFMLKLHTSPRSPGAL